MWLRALIWLIEHAGAVCQPVVGPRPMDVVLFIGPSDRAINVAARTWVEKLDEPR